MLKLSTAKIAAEKSAQSVNFGNIPIK